MARIYGDDINGRHREVAPLVVIDDDCHDVRRLKGLDTVTVVLHGFYFGGIGIDALVKQMPALRWVHAMGAGVDDMVWSELADRDVIVSNASGAFAQGMAEYVMAGMVMLARPFSSWVATQQERRWITRSEPSGTELRGKQVAIVGFGGVGRRVAQLCLALGMDVAVVGRRPIAEASEVRKYLLSELDEALASADFVVLCIALGSSTRGLLNSDRFGRIKRGAYLINVGRGELVDQGALEEALKSEQLCGAFLDVTVHEPLPKDSPLWTLPNVWITPHVAGDTSEGWRRGIDLFCDNLALFADGRPDLFSNLVDLKEFR